MKAEGGWLLLEFVTSIPAVLLLFLGIVVLFFGCIKGYLQLLGSVELREEMQDVMERITLDARMATEIVVVSPEHLKIVYAHPQTAGQTTSTSYMLYHEPASPFKVIRKRDALGYAAPQPITGGDSSWGRITIQRFQCYEAENVIHVELVGRNDRSDETYTLRTQLLKTRVAR